jgi:hypothetical protein
MNTAKKSFIFATVLGVILLASPKESFSEAVRNDSSAQVLAKGTEKEFSKFVNDNFERYSRKTEWSVVENIVTLYNQSPSKLLSTPEADRKAFDEAVKSLLTKLNRSRNEQARQWSRDLSKTTQQIKFIWNFDIDSLTPIVFETPVYVAPSTDNL